MLGTADGASAWASNEVGAAWIEKAIHKPPKVLQCDFIRKKRIRKVYRKSMLLQELMHVFGQLSANPFRGSDFLHCRSAQAIYRAEPSQQ